MSEKLMLVAIASFDLATAGSFIARSGEATTTIADERSTLRGPQKPTTTTIENRHQASTSTGSTTTDHSSIADQHLRT